MTLEDFEHTLRGEFQKASIQMLVPWPMENCFSAFVHVGDNKREFFVSHGEQATAWFVRLVLHYGREGEVLSLAQENDCGDSGSYTKILIWAKASSLEVAVARLRIKIRKLQDVCGDVDKSLRKTEDVTGVSQ